MAPDIRAERAIERYANSVYRMALLRDGDPDRAAGATAAAFGRIDWGAAVLDDQLEARLIAALPPWRRRLRDRLWQARRTTPALPPQFWRLAPAARLALGMRLGRGHTTQSIALALNEPVDTVRRLLCDSIATLAGEEPAAIEQACRHSRELRLDEPGAERVHLLSCDACRAAVPRWEGAEQALADALGRSTSALSLPREQVETILLRLRAAEPTAAPSSNPLLLRTASVVLIVLVVLALLVIPRGREETAARPPATARGIVEQAIANYGNPSGGNGVVHQRLTFLVDEPLTSYEAEVWIDPLQPARHRMQLSEDGRVGEWQSGDGARAWRYFTRLDNRYCGPSSIRTTDHISRWSMPAEDQAALRTARWQTGPWALGRQLMEQALAAPALRSLGTVTEGDRAILTLAAEGGPVEGTLLLRIDTGSGALREIRQVTADNGQTRSQTRWKLLNEESIAADAALRAGVFTSYPSRQRPREVDRAGEVIDPACLSAGEENTASVAQVLGTGWPQLVGLPALPPGLERAYLAAPEGQNAGDGGPTYNSGSLALIYLGPGKRLVLRPRPVVLQMRDMPRPAAPGGTTAGKWMLTLATRGTGRLSGTASPREAQSPASDLRLQWDFFAEGWTRDELVTLLGTVRPLSLQDWFDQRAVFFDPQPLDPDVVDVLESAARLLEPVEGRTHHVILEREVRQQPLVAALADPYHALPYEGRTETWAAYGEDGRLEKYRSEQWHSDGLRTNIAWGDSQRSQTYDVRANILRELPGGYWGMFPPTWMLQEAIHPVFRYGGFEVTARDGRFVTLAATLPISRTEYLWAIRAQNEQQPSWSGWPWLIDLDPESVTFRLQFDVSTGALRESEVTVPGPDGSVVLQRIAIPVLEVDGGPPAAGWDYVPPAGTTRVELDNGAGNFAMSGQTRMRVTRLPEVIGAAPIPLWGWPEEHALRFRDADVPATIRSSTPSYGTIEMAVEEGVAVRLRYQGGTSNAVELLQGPADLLRAILQQTPPAWQASERRNMAIAGGTHPVWIMSADRCRWAIFQLDQTLIVLQYTGEQFEEMVLPALADLEPLG